MRKRARKGRPPCTGGFQRAQPLAYLCLLSLREKVGRGAGWNARRWVLGLPSRINSPGVGRVGPLVGAGAASPAKVPGSEGRSALLVGAEAKFSS